MLTYARWKYVVMVLVLIASTLYALPNLFPPDPAVQVTAARNAPVDETLRQRVLDTLKQAGIAPKAVELEDGNLLVRLPNADVQAKAGDTLRPVLGSDYVTALSLAPTAPGWLDSIRARPMLLGLDLQGGVRFLMQVDREAALEKRVQGLAEDIRNALRDERVVYQSVEPATDAVTVTLSRPGDAERARDVILQTLNTGVIGGQSPASVEVEGGRLTVRLSEAELTRAAIEAVEQNVATLRNRVNALGVAEPVIQRQGDERIVVELPGVQDTAEAKRILGATATLEYRAVIEGDAEEAARTGIVPPGAKLYRVRGGGHALLSRRIIASGDQLIGASSMLDPQSGTPAVSVRLNSVGGDRMYAFTSRNVGKPMAVVYIERIPEVRTVGGREVRTTRVVEEVISIANIQEPFGNQFQTTGLDSMKEAADLALLLRAGSLAAPMTFVAEGVIGPSLGAENVERGLRAVMFSFVFALAFFIVYYRMFGIITCLALLLNLLMLVAVMSLFGATLTLPGLAGIALTVGMSVDANVLINERIREELRAGMPPQTAIASGYDKASGTIADANITAILAGIALFAFGTGPIQGFAVALIVGIVTSMYTAVSVSRGIATLIYGRRRKLQSIAI